MPKKAKTKAGDGTYDKALEGELIEANGNRRGVHLRARNKPSGGRQGPSVADRTIHTILGLKYEGDLPHEFLLRVVRGERIEHGIDEKGEPKYVMPTFAQRIVCAKEAAPYYAPKMATINIEQTPSDGELDRLIRDMAAAAGIALTASKDALDGEKEAD